MIDSRLNKWNIHPHRGTRYRLCSSSFGHPARSQAVWVHNILPVRQWWFGLHQVDHITIWCALNISWSAERRKVQYYLFLGKESSRSISQSRKRRRAYGTLAQSVAWAPIQLSGPGCPRPTGPALLETALSLLVVMQQRLPPTVMPITAVLLVTCYRLAKFVAVSTFNIIAGVFYDMHLRLVARTGCSYPK